MRYKKNRLIYQDSYLVNINVKTHVTYPDTGDVMLTGKEPAKIERLRDVAKELGLVDVYLLFVDIKLRQCYGDYLSQLAEEHTFNGIHFPHKRLTHSDRIQYWSVLHMPTQFHISKQDCDRIAKLRFENRSDKNQMTLL